MPIRTPLNSDIRDIKELALIPVLTRPHVTNVEGFLWDCHAWEAEMLTHGPAHSERCRLVNSDRTTVGKRATMLAYIEIAETHGMIPNAEAMWHLKRLKDTVRFIYCLEWSEGGSQMAKDLLEYILNHFSGFERNTVLAIVIPHTRCAEYRQLGFQTLYPLEQSFIGHILLPMTYVGGSTTAGATAE